MRYLLSIRNKVQMDDNAAALDDSCQEYIYVTVKPAEL